jgi:hypothetical protein
MLRPSSNLNKIILRVPLFEQVFYGDKVRWSGQLIDAPDGESRQGALFETEPVVRTFDTPGFRGATFYEVRAKTVLNRVPGDSPIFGWTVNPYRGCGHRCV